MTFNEILETVRGKAANADISGIGFLAVQVNLTGNDGGVFYIEVKDGRISVEPYDYIDRSCGITLSNDDFVKMMNGELDAVKAFTAGRLKVDGDLGKALEFSRIVGKNL